MLTENTKSRASLMVLGLLVGGGALWAGIAPFHDSHTFEFEVKSPGLVVLHYQAKDVTSKDEVSVNVNGVEVGWLPADSIDTNERKLELVVPANLVKVGERNALTFRTMRGADTWKVWNVRTELVAPGSQNLEQGLVAWVELLFKQATLESEHGEWSSSYVHFRRALRLIEALPPKARPFAPELARDKMNEARRALDEK